MKAIQIKNYSKEINTALSDIPKPQISDSEVLIQVKAAAVNLICSGPSKGRYQRCFFVPAIVGTTLISAFYAMIMYFNDNRFTSGELAGMATCVMVIVLMSFVLYGVYRFTRKSVCRKLGI